MKITFISSSPFFLPFACFCVLAVCSSFFVTLLLPSFLPFRLYSSAVRLSSASGLLLLVFTCFPHPFLHLVPLQFLAFPLLLPVPCWSPFFLLLWATSASSPITCLLLMRWFSLSPSWLFSALVTLLQGCLSVYISIRLSFSFRLLRLCFL